MASLYNQIKTKCVYRYQNASEEPHIEYVEGVGFLEKTGRT